MTMEEREGALVITRLPIEQMGLLTLGLALTGEERQVWNISSIGKQPLWGCIKNLSPWNGS